MTEQQYKIADTDEVPSDGSRIISEIKGREIAVFRIDGEFYAVANYCVHQSGPLCEGELTDRMKIGDDGWEWVSEGTNKTIVCPWHCWRFDVTTGVNVDDDRYSVPTYDVEVKGDEIYVTIA